MIGIDTNIIVRFVTQDDERQAKLATHLMEETLTATNPGFVGIVVITELASVLVRSYGLNNRQIAAAIEALLVTDVLIVEREQEVYTAVIALKLGGRQFADALIGELGASAGCSHTLTFDRRAAHQAHMALLA